VRARGLVASPDFESGAASDEGAEWVGFPHPPTTSYNPELSDERHGRLR